MAAPVRTKTAPARAAWPVQWAAGLLVALNGELLTRLMNDPQAPVYLQRREELYGALSMLALLLVLASRWSPLLRPYRRGLGVAAFGCAAVHALLAVQHVLGGDLGSLTFLNPGTQASFWLGIVALAGLLPLALTSTTPLQRRLGRRWKPLHRLGPPLTLLAALHTAWAGVHFGLWPLSLTGAALLAATLALVLTRPRRPRPTRLTGEPT